MANKTLKLVLCYSSLCTKLQNGIHAEDWYAYVQAIVSHQANIYQTDLNCLHTGTGSPALFLLLSHEARQLDESF